MMTDRAAPFYIQGNSSNPDPLTWKSSIKRGITISVIAVGDADRVEV